MDKEPDKMKSQSDENFRPESNLQTRKSSERSTRMKDQHVFIGHHINKWHEMMENLDLTSVSLANHLFEVHERHCSFCLYYKADDESQKRSKRRSGNEPIVVPEHAMNTTDFSQLAERNNSGVPDYQMFITPHHAEKDYYTEKSSSSRRKPAVTERIPQLKDANSEVKNEPVWEEVDYNSHRNAEAPGQTPQPNKVPVIQEQVSSQHVNQDPMPNSDEILSNQDTAGADHEGEIKNPTFVHSFGENIDMSTDFETTIKTNIALAIEMVNNGTSPVTKGAMQKRAYRDRVKMDATKWQRQKEKAAQRMRERREKLKRDTDKYKQYCAVGAERARKYRQNMTEEEKNRVKEKNRARARQRRQKQRLECELQKFYFNLIQQQKDRIKARIASGETTGSATDLLDEHGLQLEGDLQEQYNQMMALYQQKLATGTSGNDDDDEHDTSMDASLDSSMDTPMDKTREVSGSSTHISSDRNKDISLDKNEDSCDRIRDVSLDKNRDYSLDRNITLNKSREFSLASHRDVSLDKSRDFPSVKHSDVSMDTSREKIRDFSLDKRREDIQTTNQSNHDRYSHSEVSTGSSDFDHEETTNSKYFDKGLNVLDNHRFYYNSDTEREKLYKQLPGMNTFSFKNSRSLVHPPPASEQNLGHSVNKPLYNTEMNPYYGGQTEREKIPYSISNLKDEYEKKMLQTYAHSFNNNSFTNTSGLSGATKSNQPLLVSHDHNRQVSHDHNRPVSHDHNRPVSHDHNRPVSHDHNRMYSSSDMRMKGSGSQSPAVGINLVRFQPL